MSFVFSFVFFCWVYSLVNELLIKEQLKIHRPSIRFLEKEIGLNADGFYQQENKQLRREYLKKYLLDRKSQKIKVKGACLNDDVLQVWIKEAGYSFPSGHTVSAFLVTILLGYLIIVRKGSLYKYWLVVLFMWAVVIAYSRVVLGVHTPVDVFGGAVWGSVISFGLILSGSLKSVFVNKEPLKKIG
ncbi:phosphatidylglycerophosphatase B [Saccharicrinis fermentans DSM 9555 = JCM 21142]|uniref:Phosphatidylglycerophosphatase B n=1 Tax=Saccharicrinis fermentans DSM 9555 = JCM 21142 TaxID=869213 RepID=W7YPN2_9BACT|nr:phosphatidylglycerophosphatase B [Saccharicrinis fermentans DSM 9555 = JCM 21142]